MLIQIVHKIHVRAEDRVEKEYVTQLKRIAGKETLLYHIAEAAVGYPDELVRNVVFPVASETLLQDLIKEYKSNVKLAASRPVILLALIISYDHTNCSRVKLSLFPPTQLRFV